MVHRLGIFSGPGMWKWIVTFGDRDLSRDAPLEFLVGLEEGRPHNPTKLLEARGLYASHFLETESRFWVRVILNQITRRHPSGKLWDFSGWLVRPDTTNILVRGHYRMPNNSGYIIFETAEEAVRREHIQAAKKICNMLTCTGQMDQAREVFEWTLKTYDWDTDQYLEAEKQGLI